jgi:hypothetical protein
MKEAVTRWIQKETHNRPEMGKKIAYKANREEVAERFVDPQCRRALKWTWR